LATKSRSPAERWAFFRISPAGQNRTPGSIPPLATKSQSPAERWAFSFPLSPLMNQGNEVP
jgi:hypothetical protein